MQPEANGTCANIIVGGGITEEERRRIDLSYKLSSIESVDDEDESDEAFDQSIQQEPNKDPE